MSSNPLTSMVEMTEPPKYGARCHDCGVEPDAPWYWNSNRHKQVKVKALCTACYDVRVAKRQDGCAMAREAEVAGRDFDELKQLADANGGTWKRAKVKG